MDKIVEVSNVSFKYDKEFIFKNISFDISKGDFVGLIGANGTGKSTLIKLMLGQLKPDEGYIKIYGENPINNKNLNKVGYVPQVGLSRGIDFPATVSEIVMLNMYKEIGFLRFPKKKHKEKVLDALDVVGMKKFADRKFSELSGGQQQRVIIAKAIVSNPEILILDEPTTGIDHKSEKALYELLEKLHNESNIAIVMISHDIEKIKKKSNKLIEIENFYSEEVSE